MHHCILSTQNEQGLGGGKQRHQICYMNRNRLGEEGTQKPRFSIAGVNCYWLPLQSVQKEALQEGRVRESNLVLGLSLCLGQICLLADYGENVY